MANDTSVLRSSGSSTPLEHWDQWYERCAIGLCSKSAQATLRLFGGQMFSVFLKRYEARGGTRYIPPTPADKDAWHLLETHMTIPGVKSGKRYKDWLFARAGGEDATRLDTLRASATLLVRSTVRRFIMDESAPPGQESLDAPLDSVGCPELTLRDLLTGSDSPPGGMDEGALDTLADQHAASLSEELPTRIRVALSAKNAGRSLAHPTVTADAGCGKSVLRDDYRKYLMALFERLQTHHPRETHGVLVDLAVQVVERLKKRMAWDPARRPLTR